MDDTQVALSTETAFRLLADRTRRRLLRYLIAAESETVRVDDLTVALADAPAAASREDIEAALYHVHLPKLDAENVVVWAPGCETIRYRPTETLEDLLSALPVQAG